MSLLMLRRAATVAACALALGACHSHRPKPDAAPPAAVAAPAPSAVRPELAFGDYAVDARFNETLYLSKEAASGGRSLAGGGCGCN
jgi:hypothetical protein